MDNQIGNKVVENKCFKTERIDSPSTESESYYHSDIAEDNKPIIFRLIKNRIRIKMAACFSLPILRRATHILDKVTWKPAKS